jgi:hypothetical protein
MDAMRLGFEEYLLYDRLAEMENVTIRYQRERAALSVRPPRRWFHLSFRWARRGHAVTAERCAAAADGVGVRRVDAAAE